MAIAVLAVVAIFAAVSRKVIVVETVIGVVVIVLLVSILVMAKRRKKRASTSQIATTDYYADLREEPGGAADPFAAFAATAAPSAADPFAAFAATAGATASFPTEPAHARLAVPEPSAVVGMAALSAPGGIAGTTSSGVNGSGLPPFAVPAPQAFEPVGVASVSDPDIVWSGASAQTPAPPPPPVAVVTDPPPGTPAAWLPDPGGTPDTLRYWNGNAWTQHFAQRG